MTLAMPIARQLYPAGLGGARVASAKASAAVLTTVVASDARRRHASTVTTVDQ